ncbi:hypothetical protein GCM10011581_12290 [Saccharopolyspora subtropica]|uniref:Uncharacterized protein n=1 Tax=Saccharopolyspora thermophila TaxID=89367 RepID=A0A917NA30_9PSEU|nr:hypothetical protein [Saccharopolyspora subtropica]GGI76720.1 hypothetical protein GCM10011581_12290 [Saccharopolyspora subtropica]
MPLLPTIDDRLSYNWRVTPVDVGWELPEPAALLRCLQEYLTDGVRHEADVPIPV